MPGAEVPNPIDATEVPKPVGSATPEAATPVYVEQPYDPAAIDAAREVRAAEARQVVGATPNQAVYQPGDRTRDADGGNSEWGYNGGDHSAETARMADARNNLAVLNGLPTDGEKQAMRNAEAAKAARPG